MRRIVLYDRTCRSDRGRLSPVWAAGTRLYRALGRIDAAHGVASWEEALGILARQREAITEVQYWGHGRWGRALVRDDRLEVATFARHAAALDAIRERLAPDALIWLRTCETFGARAGHDFAQRLSERLGARVAGHTYIIGFHQSGLHGLAPGMRPDWSDAEGLCEGTPDEPQRAAWSRPWRPNTVTALHARVPSSWFSDRR